MLQASLKNYTEAESNFQRALEIREKTFGPEHPEVADVLINIALLRREEGRFSEAEAFFDRALAIREKVLGPEHAKVADVLNDLAVVDGSQGKHKEAAMYYRRRSEERRVGKECRSRWSPYH